VHRDLVWVHDAALSWQDPALLANPDAAVAFVVDQPRGQAEPWAFHRLAFVLDGVDDLFTHLPNATKLVRVGAPAEQLADLARKLGAQQIHVTEHPNPAVVETVMELRSQFAVIVHPRPILTQYAEEPRRFSRYWEKVAGHVLGYRPASSKRWHK
jgi:hypothetical protein